MTNTPKKPSETAVVSKQQFEPMIAKFKVHDFVRLHAESGARYKVITVRDHEPCCQVRLAEDESQKLRWMITEEMELFGEMEPSE